MNRLILFLFVLCSCAVNQPQNLGVHNKVLTNCPCSANCVNSFSTTIRHYIKPLPYHSKPELYQKLQKVIIERPRTEVVKQTDNYIHFTTSELFFGYKDDTELYFDENSKLLHFRSAARQGYSDHGANANRIHEIIDALEYPRN